MNIIQTIEAEHAAKLPGAKMPAFQPGDTVTWTNHDNVAHSVAGATTEWGTYTTYPQGQAVSFTFDQPGTYSYYCFEHIGMIGTIVVGDGVRDAALAASVRRAATKVPDATPPAVAAAVGASSARQGTDWMPLGIIINAITVIITVEATTMLSIKARESGPSFLTTAEAGQCGDAADVMP